jgi:energy-coupling factor transporter ATP-binding protein EcfA2
MEQTLQIRELNLDTIRPNEASMKTNLGGSKIVILGKPGSGKSVLIKHLLFAKKHLIPVGFVISGSEETNSFYSSIFPDIFIYHSYDKKIIEKLKSRQKAAKTYLQNGWNVLVLDDCMDDPRAFSEPIIKGLFKNGRHWDILAIFANQYVFDFKPELRASVDGVFIFREATNTNREKIFKNFASIIPSYEIFCKLMDELTQDYTCLYIDNQAQSNNWVDCVFYFKADPNIPNFTFGSIDYQRFAATRTNQRTDDEDVNEFMKKNFKI